MKKLKLAIMTAALLLAGVVVLPSVAMAQADQIQDGVNKIDGPGRQPTLESQIEIIVNTLLFVLGAIAVIMIVIGGIRYATAGGDQSALTAAKNTILYAVIGLVVAIMAYGIVNFVLEQF
jgi:hypothetical protein